MTYNNSLNIIMKKNQAKKLSEPEKDIKDIEEEIVVEQEGEILDMSKKAEEYLDGWKRTQAEFDNYRKMQAESQKDLIKYSAQNIILQVIPVLDNFHMSTDHIPEDQKTNGWVTGIMYIQKQLETVLADNGVDEIDTKIGDIFDTTKHEAIEDKECTHCKSDKKFENKIKKVVMKGYKMGERVIRPARVVVE
jgi:molecular chaperone GrpE